MRLIASFLPLIRNLKNTSIQNTSFCHADKRGHTPNCKQKGITVAAGHGLFSHKLSRKIGELKQNTKIIAANTGYGGLHKPHSWMSHLERIQELNIEGMNTLKPVDLDKESKLKYCF